jgi:chromosome segregation ATPase
VPNIAGIIHIEPNTEERMAFLREDIVRAEYPDLDQTITEREERIHYLDEQIGIKKVKKRQLKVASHRLDVDILDRQNDLREVLREVNDAKIVRNRLADDITSLRAKLEEYDE